MKSKIEMNEKETPTWKIILIFIVIFIGFITLIALFSNLIALRTIIGLPNIINSINNHTQTYESYGIDENGNYNCSINDWFNGMCHIKCVKSCELINSKYNGTQTIRHNYVCVC